MNTIKSISDFEDLFSRPFEPKKVIYSLSSDFFRKGNEVCKFGAQQFAVDLDEEDKSYSSLPEFPCGEMGCRVLFTNVQDYEIHFRSAHSLVCSECKRNFPSYNMLDVHIQEKHDSYHEAAKAKNLAKFKCFVEGCCNTYYSSDQRDSHVISDHNFPPNFKYQQLKKPVSKPEAMEVTEEERVSKSNLPSSSTRKPYVPSNVCFGRGSARTFSKKRSKKTNREISMKELGDAL